MSLDPFSAVVDLVNGVGSKLVDRLFPDKVTQAAERARAEFEIAKLTQDGDIRAMQASLSAILAEAQSTDPWTSRARPSFMYVIYLLILFSIPMGILSAFKPEIASAIAHGMTTYLQAIPDSLYTLFGVGYLGYTGAKSWETKKKSAPGVK